MRSVTQNFCKTLFGDAGAVGGNIDHLFRCQALDLPMRQRALLSRSGRASAKPATSKAKT
jgi:hypothetical protein